MFGKNRMEYVIKSCSAEDAQALQNLLNEMSMNGNSIVCTKLEMKKSQLS